jgi:CRP-like cAMP-binding protein
MASGATLASPDIRTFVHGAIVYREGDRATTPFVVQRGAIHVVACSSRGRQCVTAVAGPGDLFGEDALAGGVRTGSAIAVGGNGTVTRPAPDDHPALVTLLAERARVATVSLQGLLLHDATSRIARQLADLAGRHGRQVAAGVLIPMSLTQEHLALMAGTTRETANKVLREFERNGWIRKGSRRRILVTDLDSVRIRAELSA